VRLEPNSLRPSRGTANTLQAHHAEVLLVGEAIEYLDLIKVHRKSQHASQQLWLTTSHRVAATSPAWAILGQ
jgi:hypothetical protein